MIYKLYCDTRFVLLVIIFQKITFKFKFEIKIKEQFKRDGY